MKLFKFSIMMLISLALLACASNVPLKKSGGKKQSLDAQIQNLTKQIVVSLSQKKKSKIAVIEFVDLNGNITTFGKYMAEELITRLYRTNKFEVIERQLLNKVLQEHRLNLSGLIDVSSAKELGRLLGVDAIASGSVTDLGASVKINARLISTETGKIFSVASVTVEKDDMVRKLMNETAGSPMVMNKSQNSSVVNSYEKTEKGELKNFVVKTNEYTFELTKCELENRKLTCSLIITNETEKDLDFRIIIPKTRLFDKAGNEYPASVIKIANSTSKPGWYRLEKMIVPAVPTQMEIVFEEVSTTTKGISLLDLKIERNVGEVKFRNVPLEIIK